MIDYGVLWLHIRNIEIIQGKTKARTQKNIQINEALGVGDGRVKDGNDNMFFIACSIAIGKVCVYMIE